MKEEKTLAETIKHKLRGVESFSVGGVGAGACYECECDCGAKDPRLCDCAHEPHGHIRTSCNTCGSMVEGNRHPAHGFIDGDIFHFDICDDCVEYHAKYRD